jgi:chromosome segregation protein
VRAQEAEQRSAQADLERGRSESEMARGAAEERLQALACELAEARAAVPAAEEADRQARAAADEAQRELQRAEQQLELEQAKRGHAEKLFAQLNARQARLEEERDALELPQPSELVRLDRELQEVSEALVARRETLALQETVLPEKEEHWRAALAHAEQLQQRQNQIDARLKALQALQEQVSRSGEVTPWLERHALIDNPHLWQGLRIRDGWDDALEAVLRERLNSIGLDDLRTVEELLAAAPPGKVSFHQLGATTRGAVPNIGLTPLIELVTCTDARVAGVLEDWLAGVYAIEHAQEAFNIAGQLGPGAMLVTAQGHLFTATSARFHAADSEIHGILSRQREIEALFGEQRLVNSELESARHQARIQETALEEARASLEGLRHEVLELQEAQHRLKVDHVRLSQQAERVTSRGNQIMRELEEIGVEALREARQVEEASQALQELGALQQELRAALAEARRASGQAEEALREQRESVQRLERDHQEGAFQARTIDNKISELENSLQQLSQHLTRSGDELLQLQTELAETEESDVQVRLQSALSSRGERESVLAGARRALEEAEQALKQVEQERMGAEHQLEPLRTRINDLRLKEQEARLAEENFAQQLHEAGADEQTLAQQIEKGVRASHLQTEIGRLNAEIAALGAVNLAALDELTTARERKTYLDAQSADLTEAVATLENAIRRIDRETRERLQETFDQVNRHFSEMFPALFGGGEAKLLMTGEEILDAGIQVIARPPGKKNSSIHLLSGGEKALTALALVFSMFHLNPAPFCLLDEVDAPLDDHNTDRFCDLVRRMSKQTQFLFITHNKITMELAQQLIGVTMQEQGVSRVVAVDIEEALKMREQAA